MSFISRRLSFFSVPLCLCVGSSFANISHLPSPGGGRPPFSFFFHGLAKGKRQRDIVDSCGTEAESVLILMDILGWVFDTNLISKGLAGFLVVVRFHPEPITGER